MISSKHIPNFITALRIIGTVCLLFLEPLSPVFYVIYTLAGLSDVLDGWLARKLKVSSEFGAKLDSISDLLYYAVMLIKILPVLIKKLPHAIWYMVGLIVVVRFISYSYAINKFGHFPSLHTYMNKISAGALFTVPYAIVTAVAVPICVAVCVIALGAALEELTIHIKSNQCVANRKSLFGKS